MFLRRFVSLIAILFLCTYGHAANTIFGMNTLLGTNNLGGYVPSSTCTSTTPSADLESDSSQQMTRANASLSGLKFGDEDFTITAWINMESKAASGSINTILALFDTALAQRSYNVQYRNFVGEDRFYAFISSDGVTSSSVVANNLGAPSTSTEYLLVFKHDATANTISLSANNGTADTAAHSGGAFSTTTSDFRIGAVNAISTFFFDGLIYQVTAWSKVIDSTEETNLYNAGSGVNYSCYSGDTSELVSWWEWENGSTTFIDQHGTNDLTNATSVVAGPPL